MSHRLLLVEDDTATAESLARGLAADGFSVRWVRTAADASASLASQPADVVVLDWMLPGSHSGIDLLRAWRAAGQNVPVLLLTARDAIPDRVDGLEAGADDYLAKPFAFAELLARVRALRRRARAADPLHFSLADLTIDLETRRARRGEVWLDLTPREFDLLVYLARRTGEVVGREQLARDVWGEPNRATPIDNVIDVHVARLRRKLDEGRTQRLLHTVRGVGLMLRADAPT